MASRTLVEDLDKARLQRSHALQTASLYETAGNYVTKGEIRS